MSTAIERAAQARREAMGAPADRPRDRRCAQNMAPLVSSRALTRRPIEVRDAQAGDGLDFTGYASVFGAPYDMYDFFGPYSEQVTAGAFTDTLNQVNLDVPLVLNHDSLRRIARTTNGSLLLAEDDIGLRTDAPNLDPTDADVAYIAPKLRAGLIDEMSFMFRITNGKWSPDYTSFQIDAADIHRGDVSIVGFGASPTTSAELRSLVETIAHGREPADLTGVDVELLRGHERAIRRELQRRGTRPSMSLQDLLAI